jgi:hypothetical protein
MDWASGFLLRPPQRIVGEGGDLIIRVIESEQICNAVVCEFRASRHRSLGEAIDAVILKLRAIT